MEKLQNRQRDEQSERLQFESLLFDISSKYINLPVNRIDMEIEDDQRRICEYLGLDLSSLWQWQDKSRQFMRLTHLYTCPGGPEPEENIEANSAFPWIVKKLGDRKPIIVSTEKMIDDAEVDQKSLRFFGVKSSAIFPLSTGGAPFIGILSFSTLWEELEWPDHILLWLTLVAQIFGNALTRKEMEKDLRKSETRLSLAANAAETGLWELDIDTGLFWATERTLEIFEHTSRREPLSMKRVEQLIYPEDRGHVRRAISQALESGSSIDLEYRVRIGDKSTKWVHSRGEVHFNSDGTPKKLLGISTDITSRKCFEFKLRTSEERLASAIDIAELGFYEMGKDYRILFMDERMRSFLGVPREESKSREFWLAHIHEKDTAHVHDVIHQVLEKGENHFTMEYRYQHPERGTIWLHHLSRVLERNSDGLAVRVIGVMQDITEQKQAEQRLIESTEVLENNQKDLRRLTGKLISLQEEEMCRISRELHDDLTQRLAALAIEAGKLQLHPKKTVNETSYALARIKEQLISLSQDVHNMSRQLHPTIISDLGLISAIEEELATVMQREDIEIVFEHTPLPENIAPEISLCLYRIIQEGLKNVVVHSGAECCEVVLGTDEHGYRLTIRDSGVGFDHRTVKLKPGLGLSSMRERSLLVNGAFRVESGPGRGTAVHVTIPYMEK